MKILALQPPLHRRIDQHDIGELTDIEPMHVSLYIETLQATAAKPTVKQHLAAIRMLFDWLVTGQVVATNPAHAVRVTTMKGTALCACQ